MAWLMFTERVPGPAQQRRRFGDVQSVYVVPEVRGRGIGAALVQALLIEAGTLKLGPSMVKTTPSSLVRIVCRTAGSANVAVTNASRVASGHSTRPGR